jgi:hypothetical protein
VGSHRSVATQVETWDRVGLGGELHGRGAPVYQAEAVEVLHFSLDF